MRGLRMTQEQVEAHQRRIGRSRPAITPKSRQRPPVAMSGCSDPLPHMLANQCRAAGLPQPLVEYPFSKHLGRKHRADCCFVEQRLIVEIQGAVHRIAGRFQADRERSQVIAILGYRLMLVSPTQVRSGEAVELVRQALLCGTGEPLFAVPAR